MELCFDEILPQMIIKYGSRLNPEISSIKFQRGYERYFLTLTFSKPRGDISTYSTNLDIFGGDTDSGHLFEVDDDFGVNKEKFFELDDYSLIMIIENLFTDEYTKEILSNNGY